MLEYCKCWTGKYLSLPGGKKKHFCDHIQYNINFKQYLSVFASSTWDAIAPGGRGSWHPASSLNSIRPNNNWTLRVKRGWYQAYSQGSRSSADSQLPVSVSGPGAASTHGSASAPSNFPLHFSLGSLPPSTWLWLPTPLLALGRTLWAGD